MTVTANPGTGGASFGTRTIAGIDYSYVINGFVTAGVFGEISDTNGMPTRPRAPVPDAIVASTTLDPTALNAVVSVTPNGNGTVFLKIGTPGVAFPGGTVVVFEAVTEPGQTPAAFSVYPRAPLNSGRIKSTSVGGEFVVEATALGAVQARVAAVGTGAALPVVIGMAAPSRILTMSPVNVGQTTRTYDRVNKQRLTTSGTRATSAAVAASEVMLHARGSAIWIDINTAAIAASAPICLEAGERFHMQISPGDLIDAIQDTAAGVLIITPVA
jgi:hypothetical protein